MKKPSMEESIENSNIVVVNGSESSSDSENGDNNYPDTHINGTKSLFSSSRRSSSSSLSESLSNDFFRIDALKFTPEASELASKSGENYASSSESSRKSEVDNSPQVQTSTYKVYNVASSQKGMSPTISPPIQVMDRSGTYDPTRIPSSIFERNNNNNNPLEWSIASNESLFSIHIGQNSFSRDHAIKFGEVRLSEELTKPVELNMFNRIPSVTIEEIESARESVEIESVHTSEESFRFKPNHIEDENDVKSLQVASSMSTKSSLTTPSYEGGSISHSFVPLKKRSRRLCYCCNCSWAFCHHKRPTCCHIWPSYKCSCGWLFCGFCNGDRSTPMMTKTELNSFVKTDSLRQHSHKQESETTSSSSASSWCCFQSKNACDFCSCCSCFSCSCCSCFSCPSCTCKLSCTRWRCCCC